MHLPHRSWVGQAPLHTGLLVHCFSGSAGWIVLAGWILLAALCLKSGTRDKKMDYVMVRVEGEDVKMVFLVDASEVRTVKIP